MGRARDSIIADRYPEFLKEYFETLYGGDRSKIPDWIIKALRTVAVDLLAG